MRPAIVVLLAALILAVPASAQGQFYLPPGTLTRFGLDSLEITSLAAEVPHGSPYPQGMLAGFPLFAGTKGHGVYAVLPFASAAPQWQGRGLEGRTVTALNVQHRGANGQDWLTTHAAVLDGSDSTTTELVANPAFTGAAFPADTCWQASLNDSVRMRLPQVRAITSGNYGAQEQPLPVFMGGSKGIYRVGVEVGPDTTRRTVMALDSVDIYSLASRWTDSSAAILAGGAVRGVPVVYRSTDGGLTWAGSTLLWGGWSLPVRTFGLTTAAGNDTMYAAGGSGLWQTSDGGLTWRHVEGLAGPLGPVALDIDPFHSTPLYVAYAGVKGFYQTRNAGAVWKSLGVSEMGQVTSMAMVYPASPDSLPYLFLGTQGTGVWAYRPERERAHFSKPFYYPLAKGNVWEYLYYGTRNVRHSEVVGDTLMPDGYRYAQILSTYPGQSFDFQRQQGDTIFQYRPDSGRATVLYDLGQETGSFVTWYPEKWTYVRLSIGPTFGRQLRTWDYSWHELRSDFSRGAFVVDSLGMMQSSSVPGVNYWYLQGASIDGVRYGTLTSAGDPQFLKQLPVAFRLEQNYPNPFNPTTTIRYSLPHRALVTLTVFNLLGQKVAELVNSDIVAGVHEVSFDAMNLASGVYFYRLQAGGYQETRKFILTK